MKKIFSMLLISVVVASSMAQSGGGYNLEQNVIGNGGWRSDGSGFTVLGTMGQGNAGSIASGGAFHLIDGLWAIENPTANSPFVTIRGTITRARGNGIPRVRVTIKNLTTNVSYETWSGAHGYYEITDITTNANYLISVSHKHFVFQPDSIGLFVSQDRNNVNFVSVQ